MMGCPECQSDQIIKTFYVSSVIPHWLCQSCGYTEKAERKANFRKAIVIKRCDSCKFVEKWADFNFKCIKQIDDKISCHTVCDLWEPS